MNAILVPTLGELGAEFDRALANERSTLATVVAYEKSVDDPMVDHQAGRKAEHEYHAAATRTGDVAQQIAALPSLSAEHVRLKARALVWMHDGSEPATAGDRLALDLARAILDGRPQ